MLLEVTIMGLKNNKFETAFQEPTFLQTEEHILQTLREVVEHDTINSFKNKLDNYFKTNETDFSSYYSATNSCTPLEAGL
ncbi:unnamed protein product [Brachionus calyciflorus]|uniref:Uncharacterized protein n=1 Tax=Brachionus calyciflorus TaxID=104777 RepID=A0A814INN8_9BILA|nr:unnamed protein product [Brachionus calyciflorus]